MRGLDSCTWIVAIMKVWMKKIWDICIRKIYEYFKLRVLQRSELDLCFCNGWGIVKIFWELERHFFPELLLLKWPSVNDDLHCTVSSPFICYTARIGHIFYILFIYQVIFGRRILLKQSKLINNDGKQIFK